MRSDLGGEDPVAPAQLVGRIFIPLTEVRLKGLEDKGKLKAAGSITLDDSFVVSGIGVFEGPRGLFVSLPRVLGSDGKYHDTSYPLSRDLREDISQSVLNEYRREKDLDRIIASVERTVMNEPAYEKPFSISYAESEKETEPKLSVKERIKDAGERADAANSKKNEKDREEVAL